VSRPAYQNTLERGRDDSQRCISRGEYPACIRAKPQYKKLTQYAQKSSFIYKYQTCTKSGASNNTPTGPLLKFH